MAAKTKLDAEMKVKAADASCLFSNAEQTRVVGQDQLAEEKRVTPIKSRALVCFLMIQCGSMG